jgi:hypothetical protein
MGDAGERPPDIFFGHQDFFGHKKTFRREWQEVRVSGLCFPLTSLTGLA